MCKGTKYLNRVFFQRQLVIPPSQKIIGVQALAPTGLLENPRPKLKVSRASKDGITCGCLMKLSQKLASGSIRDRFAFFCICQK